MPAELIRLQDLETSTVPPEAFTPTAGDLAILGAVQFWCAAKYAVPMVAFFSGRWLLVQACNEPMQSWHQLPPACVVWLDHESPLSACFAVDEWARSNRITRNPE